MWFYTVETWRGGVPGRLIRRHRACGQQVGHGLNGGPAEAVLITVSAGGIPIYLIMPTTKGGDRVDELWSDDFEVLHWVVERFERNGHSVEVGEALRVFPEEHYDSVRDSLRRLSSHSHPVAVNGSKPGRNGRPAVAVGADVTERALRDAGERPDVAEPAPPGPGRATGTRSPRITPSRDIGRLGYGAAGDRNPHVALARPPGWRRTAVHRPGHTAEPALLDDLRRTVPVGLR